MTQAERNQLHDEQNQTQRSHPVQQQEKQGRVSYLLVTVHVRAAFPLQHYSMCYAGLGLQSHHHTLRSLTDFLRTLQKYTLTKWHAKGSLQN